GKRVMSEVGKSLNIIFSETNLTAKVKLPGGDISSDFPAFKQEIKGTLKKYHIREETSERLAWFYGSDVHELIKYGLEEPVWFESLNKDVPAIKGEVRHDVEKKMALRLNDLMVHRVSLLL